ncbi:hypothetical protein [Candidatus Neptunochlamydia vexilliferae]|uniref:Endonuclease/exonuclease/phosphatase domain-containing protein n=1 Tax=Candidatus Neptunichlamydia vexilliferae TaxID=1651774 RepID=A0ABS0B0Q7_9BACT|nr:hypothetical protein [Candidatus Neptunochlamydia vexilliferae]MBF5059978.1 hypothetical protein [Candidatus Neptunochlamydia vexilliferae]
METPNASYLYTHLSTEDGKKSEELDEILAITQGKRWVILGDLNIDRGKAMVEKKGFIDHLDNVLTCEEESIDYVLTLKGSDISIKGEVIPTDHLSDHEAVRAVIA